MSSFESSLFNQNQSYIAAKSVKIEENLLKKWQNIADIMAELINVSAGLIMKISGCELEVLVSSHTNNNPYQVGNKIILLGSGVYCETVIKTQNKLFIGDARQTEEWQGKPDLKLGMVSYLGYPLILPDGNLFGTICVIDRKANYYSETYEKLIIQFKDLIEIHLSLLDKNSELETIVNKDWLTQLYNRKYLFDFGEKLYKNAEKDDLSLSIAVIDIDFFKKINDVYGHDAGDFILKEFSKILIENTRATDTVYRLGGEEFCILLTHSNLEKTASVCERIRKILEEKTFDYNNYKFSITMSCGISSVLEGSLEKMIKKADDMLYKAKNNGRNQVCFK